MTILSETKLRFFRDQFAEAAGPHRLQDTQFRRLVADIYLDLLPEDIDLDIQIHPETLYRANKCVDILHRIPAGDLKIYKWLEN
jgi:hypothetical protein